MRLKEATSHKTGKRNAADPGRLIRINGMKEERRDNRKMRCDEMSESDHAFRQIRATRTPGPPLRSPGAASSSPWRPLLPSLSLHAPALIDMPLRRTLHACIVLSKRITVDTRSSATLCLTPSGSGSRRRGRFRQPGI